MRETISLEQKGMVEGAKQRLAHAQQALADFELEHDGQVVSPELRASLERERHLLDVELDEAQRQYAKALEDADDLAASR